MAIKTIPNIQIKTLANKKVENFSNLRYKTAINAVQTGVVLNITIPSDKGKILIPENQNYTLTPPIIPLKTSLPYAFFYPVGYVSTFKIIQTNPFTNNVKIDLYIIKYVGDIPESDFI